MFKLQPCGLGFGDVTALALLQDRKLVPESRREFVLKCVAFGLGSSKVPQFLLYLEKTIHIIVCIWGTVVTIFL